MNTYDQLNQLFTEKYSFKALKNTDPTALKNHLLSRIASVDQNIESYIDASKQRDLSIKFHWGHHHDFGDGFFLPGCMEDRHIRVIAGFCTDLGLGPDLSGKKVLDIGVWTGGTSLLLAAMGAQVTAIEEVIKYAEIVNYLAYAFGIEKNLACFPRSLYDFLPQVCDEFDLVLYPGVLYHVSDPILSLRLVFSALKDRGKVFIETLAFKDERPLCRYEGPAVTIQGSQENLNRSGWNYFIPSPSCLDAWCKDAGFQEVVFGPWVKSRITAAAVRINFQDFCRAGISKTSCR